jgi:hypothetical protein
MSSGKKRAEVVELRLADIRTDGGTQAREEIDDGLVAEYAEAMAGGVAFPPLGVFHDGAAYGLVDGHHRIRAASLNELEGFACEVTRGTLEAARWHVLATNAAHGKRRTNADKRRCVGLAFDMRPELSDGAIAAHVGVSQPFVSKLRKERATQNGYGSASRVGLDGRTIDTSRIGGRCVIPPEDHGSTRDVSLFDHGALVDEIMNLARTPHATPLDEIRSLVLQRELWQVVMGRALINIRNLQGAMESEGGSAEESEKWREMMAAPDARDAIMAAASHVLTKPSVPPQA